MAPHPGQIRPWRLLSVFAGIVVLLYVLVFFTGDGRAAPKLGIDLQGGSRVTLTARTLEKNAATGKCEAPPREQLLQAQQIIEQRVNGFGVSGAEVVLDGENLTITVPGSAGDQLSSLGQTAQLRFREVIYGPVPAAPPVGAAPAPGAVPAPVAPGTSSPTPGQSQGAADPAVPVVERAVAPVAFTEPLQAPTPAPAPAPAQDAPGCARSDASGPADPQLAAKLAQARQIRQNPALLTDQTAQQVALASLDCANPQDPLRGYDDPDLPLVTCGDHRTNKYVLGPRFLDGTEIDTAMARQDDRGVGWVIDLTFKSKGRDIWGKYTTENVGKSAAFVLDGEVKSAPRINQPIFGVTQISGQFSQTEAKDLAGVLRYGSLPLSFESSEAQNVSATLGLASLRAGLIAGGLGLLLVFIYCLFYYRALGVLTILSLVLSGAVVFAVLVLLGRWVGFTLDLAGVAGFIVAIGITADSFVIFFERLKDEMREGRTFRSAVPRGWVRARRTILSADAVSFLASAVLYVLAVGQVKGFAFTLGLSTVLDLLVVFLVTHPLVVLASNSRVFGSPAWSGLGSVARIGAERRKAATTGAGKGA